MLSISVLVIVVIIIWIFNPYMSYIWRSACERWHTRERSYGHPFYSMIKERRCIPQPLLNELYNRTCKKTCYKKNVIYIE